MLGASSYISVTATVSVSDAASSSRAHKRRSISLDFKVKHSQPYHQYCPRANKPYIPRLVRYWPNPVICCRHLPCSISRTNRAKSDIPALGSWGPRGSIDAHDAAASERFDWPYLSPQGTHLQLDIRLSTDLR